VSDPCGGPQRRAPAGPSVALIGTPKILPIVGRASMATMGHISRSARSSLMTPHRSIVAMSSGHSSIALLRNRGFSCQSKKTRAPVSVHRPTFRPRGSSRESKNIYRAGSDRTPRLGSSRWNSAMAPGFSWKRRRMNTVADTQRTPWALLWSQNEVRSDFTRYRAPIATSNMDVSLEKQAATNAG